MSSLIAMEELAVRDHVSDYIGNNISSVSGGVLPVWSTWFATVILSLTFFIGVPLNGITVLIFFRRKKLRHLVNFVLVLDCISHIILCFVCIPVQLASVWRHRLNLFGSSIGAKWSCLVTLQHVVGNFANLYGIFLSLSIAVLRYRRLCWKKKDRFSRMNAVKWSVTNGILALGLTFTESWTSLHPILEGWEKITLSLYAMKMTLIISAATIVLFCYIKVSQRVWANVASQKKVMDPMKLKKSRTLHRRATIHSCVQILLIMAMTSPFIYEETMRLKEWSTPAPTSNIIVMDAFSPNPTTPPMMVEKISLSTMESMTTPLEMDRMTGDLSHNNHLTRLIAVVLNYALLVLGTPIAYIASCHRYREQFYSILCGRMRKLYLSSKGQGNQMNGIGHHNNNNTNNNFSTNPRKLKSPSSPTAEVFDTPSLPRTRSLRSRSRSQPMALSPSTMISSVMSTPGKGSFEIRRASCQSMRVQIRGNRANHFFSYYSPEMHEYAVKVSSVNNGIGNHFIGNCNYSSYGSSSSTSEIVGHNV